MKAAALLLLLAAAAQAATPALRDGDLIFQSSLTSQSRAIERATNSRYSHVGLIFYRDKKLRVLEAIQPVSYALLEDWIARGKGKAYVVKRLKQPPPAEALEKVRLEGEKFLGKSYDFPFGWSDAKLYCSELVWKAYERGAGIKLSATRRLKEFNLKDPVVKAKLKERYGSKIPLEEPVVSPADLFDSDLLETVLDRK